MWKCRIQKMWKWRIHKIWKCKIQKMWKCKENKRGIDICVHNESKNYKMFNRLICVKNNDNDFFLISNAAFIFFIFHIFLDFTFSHLLYSTFSHLLYSTFSHILYSTFSHLLYSTFLHLHIFCIFELLYSSSLLSFLLWNFTKPFIFKKIWEIILHLNNAKP